MAVPNLAQTFLQEAGDLLTQIEEITLELEVGQPPGEPLHKLFRAFHTIKGSGAMFGFEQVADFTHQVETTLDRVRSGSLPVSANLIQSILAARDEIKHLLEVHNTAAPQSLTNTKDILATLAAAVEGQPMAEWFLKIRLNAGVFKSGTNPLLLLEEVRQLGECKVHASLDQVPLLGEIDPHACYTTWEIRLRTAKDRDAIRDVFIFVEDGSEITIEAVSAKAAEVAVVKAEAVTKSKPAELTVRVPSGKLDRLVNLVGELVMNQSRLVRAASDLDSAELSVPVEEIERLVSELREVVLGIRMMPIGVTFHRFKRLVHDLSGELGKQIDLITEGAETELDKTVLDQLGDPLVHLIRNSIDHGIEPAGERRLAGKPERGAIRLTAAHAGSNVTVSIHDDGRGLDAEAIRRKAVEKKLIAADAALTDKEIFQLIFLPGFSMAKQVTSVSGRGVGMDVVKRQIDALRGAVSIASAPGRGTTITLTLPLTLAIIDGLLVEIAGDPFIIPMAVVNETVELRRAERGANNGRNGVAVRGELVPYLFLREIFTLCGQEPEIEKIVIVRHEEQRVGLVVDRVLGSHQTVIQSLGKFYRNIGIVSGSTIMGDGRVALILNLAGLVGLANNWYRIQP